MMTLKESILSSTGSGKHALLNELLRSGWKRKGDILYTTGRHNVLYIKKGFICMWFIKKPKEDATKIEYYILRTLDDLKLAEKLWAAQDELMFSIIHQDEHEANVIRIKQEICKKLKRLE